MIQPDHRIVVVGQAGGQGAAMLVRFLPSGRLDRGFGVGGVARTPPSAATTTAAAVLVAPGGDLVVAGTAFSALGASGIRVARFRADGRLRTSFGTGGVTLVDFPDEDERGTRCSASPTAVWWSAETRDRARPAPLALGP